MDGLGLSCFRSRRAGRCPGRLIPWITVFSALTLALACHKARNDPRYLADSFLADLSQGAAASVDTLIAWGKMMLKEFYVTESFFNSQTPEQKKQLIESYKKKFFEQDFPFLTPAKYKIKKLVINHGISDVFLEISFGDREKPPPVEREFEPRMRMELDPVLRRWLVTDLADVLSYNMLHGQYNPEIFYLNKPVQP